jgi:hypothetical protein
MFAFTVIALLVGLYLFSRHWIYGVITLIPSIAALSARIAGVL